MSFSLLNLSPGVIKEDKCSSLSTYEWQFTVSDEITTVQPPEACTCMLKVQVEYTVKAPAWFPPPAKSGNDYNGGLVNMGTLNMKVQRFKIDCFLGAYIARVVGTRQQHNTQHCNQSRAVMHITSLPSRTPDKMRGGASGIPCPARMHLCSSGPCYLTGLVSILINEFICINGLTPHISKKQAGSS
jgi:hypothetical protein